MASIIRATTTSGLQVAPDNSGSLQLQTNGTTTAVTIDTSQNVGIGTTSPGQKLDVNGGIRTQGWGGSANNGNIIFGTNATAAQIYGDNSVMALYTNSSERMRIDSSGNVLVGKTSASSSVGNGVMLYPNGYVSVVGTTAGLGDTYNYYNTTAAAYRFYVTNAGVIYATNTTISAISDQRLKENIQDLDVGLGAVMALKPRKFDWKKGKGKDIIGDRGFIAQEFEQVFPDLIDTWKDTPPEGEEPYKSVRADLIPILVKAIQEQQTIINDLKARIETLEAN